MLAFFIVCEGAELQIKIARALTDEPSLIENHKGLNRGNQRKGTEAKLFMVDQQRILYVLLHEAKAPLQCVITVVGVALFYLPDLLLDRVYILV